MGRKTTLFERFMEKRNDIKRQFLNPLDILLGQIVGINIPDWAEHDFELVQFRIIRRLTGGKELPLVDYFLRARNLEGGETKCLLRFIPLKDQDPAAGRTQQVILLIPVNSFEHDKVVMEVLEKNAGYSCYIKNEASDQTEEITWSEQTYPSRVDSVTLPYDCQVDLIRDTDHYGKAGMEEVESYQLTLWDFWRSIDRYDKVVTQYLYVEVDQEDGWTEIFQGEEIDQDVIFV